jgi:hypothetical protein
MAVEFSASGSVHWDTSTWVTILATPQTGKADWERITPDQIRETETMPVKKLEPSQGRADDVTTDAPANRWAAFSKPIFRRRSAGS